MQEIVEQAASEILKMYVFDRDRASRNWSPQQAWYLIKALADSDTVRYNAVLLSNTWASDGDATLQALEQAELISIVSANGRPQSIKPSKPVYQAAFRYLLGDRVLQSRLDLDTLTELIKIETQSIDKCETELRLLGGLPRQPGQVGPRVRWLLSKLQASQDKVEGYEKESAALKKVLQVEY